MTIFLSILIFEANCQTFTSSLNFTVAIPEINLLDIESATGNNITFNLTSPTEAGEAIGETSSTNNTLWLNYTCSKVTNKRKVNVQINGNSPSGIKIKVLASVRAAGFGGGVFGIPASTEIELTNSPLTLISDIDGCFTGNGAGKGHQLTYSITISDYTLLESSGSSTIQILYTLSN